MFITKKVHSIALFIVKIVNFFHDRRPSEAGNRVRAEARMKPGFAGTILGIFLISGHLVHAGYPPSYHSGEHIYAAENTVYNPGAYNDPYMQIHPPQYPGTQSSFAAHDTPYHYAGDSFREYGDPSHQGTFGYQGHPEYQGYQEYAGPQRILSFEPQPARSSPYANSVSWNLGTQDGLNNFSSATGALDIRSDLKTGSSSTKESKNRWFRKLTLAGSWTPPGGREGMGISRFDSSITFVLPGPKGFWKNQSYFLISPNFTYTYLDWEGRTSFPDSLYKAGLGITWMQPIDQKKSLMISATPSFSGDGKESKDSVRCSAVLGMNWTLNEKWTVLFGIAYLDRNDLSFLPYGGLIWTPTPLWRVELIAPQARIAKRYWRTANSPIEHWFYLGGGIDGGSWAIQSTYDQADFAMYREFSLLLGYEHVNKNSCTWNFELGYLFARRMEFEEHTQSKFKPEDAFTIRLKMAF